MMPQVAIFNQVRVLQFFKDLKGVANLKRLKTTATTKTTREYCGRLLSWNKSFPKRHPGWSYGEGGKYVNQHWCEFTELTKQVK